MLADAAPRDFDLSHLKPAFPDEPEESPHRNQIPAFAYALIISLVIHAAMVIVSWSISGWNIVGWSFRPAPAPAISDQLLRVELKYIPAVKVESMEISSGVEPVKEKTTSEIDTGIPSVAESSSVPLQEVIEPAALQQDTSPQNDGEPVRVIHGLSPQELRGLVQEFKAQDQPAYGIGQNVFDPTLRKRLMEEANKPQLQRADIGPKTYTDPSGATVVDLGEGKCLRSSVANKPGETQNWYMTSCGGKSESERVMERIDQAVNGKLRFE